MEEEELYDDCESVTKPTGLSALKSRFENPSPANKPAVGVKPLLSPKSAGIAAKFGGASSTGTKPLGSVTGADKVKPVIGSAKSETSSANDSEATAKDKPVTGAPSLVKRNSKVNIPAAFQSGTPPPSFDQKPQTPAKPGIPKWKQRQDDSNNNNNKDSVTNSNVSNNSSTMVNKEPLKPNVLPKKPIATATSTGNVKDKANALFGGASPSDLKSALKPVSANINKPTGPNRINTAGETVALRAKFGPQVKAKRKSVKSIVRSKDNRKFHKVEAEDIKSDSTVPDKPTKLDTEIDWEHLATTFKKLVKDLESSNEKSGVEEIEEEDYDDIGNVLRERQSRAPSIIQPLTEEEEQEWESAGFKGLDDSNDSLPPMPPELLESQEEYDDVGILVQNGQPEDGEELYEPLPDEPEDFPPPPVLHPKNGAILNGTGKPPPPPPTDHIEKKDQKESEKEKKKREKDEKEKEKKREKEYKKKQDDLKNLMSRYKIDAQGLTQSVGKGTVLKTVKGSKKDLAVQQGDKVDIIRMVDNDKGKWLVRIINTDKADKHSCKKKSRRTVGYVESTNVELMKQKGEGDEDGETYDEVEGMTGQDLIEEEIYEECN